ncbi:hypothetical protein [Pararobbsia alpina]|uniref:Lipoprotein n=1 Tax=Pararobbsia alpina TaxID=621374 RepID=A0A6S7DC78_9BURK|nr:hypothetical protein [Pararobbsia alpina]CAB3801383.1 hypothetical protein LMG28138_05001 [Pararobbsia alpina]
MTSRLFIQIAVPVLLTACGGGSSDPAASPSATALGEVPAGSGHTQDETVINTVPSDAIAVPSGDASSADRLTDADGNVYERGADHVWRKWQGGTWVVVRGPNDAVKRDP